MNILKTTALCAALALGGFATEASATTFVFDYTSNDGTELASGTLSATANGDGAFTATTGSITASGPVATGAGTLIANASAPSAIDSPSGYFLFDDQVLPGQNPLITNPGLLFDIGGSEINIYSNGPGPGTYLFQTNNGGASRFGNFSISAVPEPASWAMMLLGMGLVGSAARFSRKQAAAAAA
jgi:hypothetical protein